MGKRYKGLDTFFGQAPQLAKILYIIIRYNLLTTSFSPTKTLFLLKGPILVRDFPGLERAFWGGGEDINEHYWFALSKRWKNIT